VNQEGGIVRGGKSVHPSMVVHLRRRGCTGVERVNELSEEDATKRLKRWMRWRGRGVANNLVEVG
jgi:hypothetical protein